MQRNQLKHRLAQGQVPLGHMLFEFTTRGTPQILDAAGVDFAIIDTEHSGTGLQRLADLLAWFRGTAVTPFVRIPRIEYVDVARTLDLGAMGIMAPNVTSAEAAQHLVEAAKYPPAGRRGVALGGAVTGYRAVRPREFLAETNDSTAILCQIESVEGLDAADAIAAVDGVDVLWVGHFDLSVSMNIPGQFDEPRFIDALRRVVDAARRAGKAAGIQPRDLAQARQWLDIGFNVISCSADIFVYGQALAQHVSTVRAALPEAS